MRCSHWSGRRAAAGAPARRTDRHCGSRCLALRLAAVERAGSHGGALRGRALGGSARDAVPRAVGRGHGAPRAETEEVVGVGEVPEAGQRADAGRHGALEEVLPDVELLDGDEAGDGGRERALEAVAADVEDGELPEQADLRRDAPGEGVVDEDDLVEGVGHLTD